MGGHLLRALEQAALRTIWACTMHGRFRTVSGLAVYPRFWAAASLPDLAGVARPDFSFAVSSACLSEHAGGLEGPPGELAVHSSSARSTSIEKPVPQA